MGSLAAVATATLVFSFASKLRAEFRNDRIYEQFASFALRVRAEIARHSELAAHVSRLLHLDLGFVYHF